MHAKSFVRKAASLAASVSLLAAMIPSAAFAGTLSGVTYVLHNNTKSASTAHEVNFTTPTGVPAGGTIVVTLPAGFNVSGLLTDGTNSTISLNGGTGDQTAISGVAVSSNIVTVTIDAGANNISAADHVTLTLGSDESITNPSGAGSYPITIQTSSGDSVGVSVAIADNADVAVTASVVGSMTLSLADNTVALGTLSPTAIRTVTKSGQISVGSNAPDGFSLIALGATELTNGAHDISRYTSQTTGTAGTEGWGINISEDSDSGSNATIDSNYSDSSKYKLQAPGPGVDTLVTSTGITSAVYSVKYGANIGTATPAGSYAGTVRYLMFGSF